MAVRVKAVIWCPDRTNINLVLKRKQIEGKTFRYDNCTYFLDPDRFMLTWVRNKFGIMKYFTTYYYMRGIAKPLPVPNFEKVEEVLRDEKGIPRRDDDGNILTEQIFPKVVDLGTSSEELHAIFNPWLYRIIAAQQKEVLKDVQFWMLMAALCGIGYLCWQIAHQHIPTADDIAKAVLHAQQVANQATISSP